MGSSDQRLLGNNMRFTFVVRVALLKPDKKYKEIWFGSRFEISALRLWAKCYINTIAPLFYRRIR